MFSSRRLKATVLLVAVMAAGFVLFEPYFIQEAGAVTCDDAMDICDHYMDDARDLCNSIYLGWLSAECANATAYAVTMCVAVLHDCT